MSASYHVFKNGSVVAITSTSSTAKKTNTAHGNPSGEGGGSSKFGSKVNSSGPISSK